MTVLFRITALLVLCALGSAQAELSSVGAARLDTTPVPMGGITTTTMTGTPFAPFAAVFDIAPGYYIIGGLGTAGRLLPALARKAELARIGRYYATESMLVWDAAARRYDAAATPSTGSRTLAHHFADVLGGHATVERGDHAVF